MKKIIVVFAFLSTLLVQAQNEIKVDLLDILVLRSLDIAFEHQLNDEASLGLSAFINFEAEDKDFRYNEEFQVVPYFRLFLTDFKGFDMYGELFGSLNFGETEEDVITNETEKYTDFALGLGTGFKHVTNNGYVIDIHAGVGRNLFNSDVSREFVPRFGISVGKQF